MLTTSNANTTPARAWLQVLLIKMLRFYQVLLRPVFGNRCRFLPTCSEYALEAISSHGSGKGLYLTVHRLCRCNPCVEGGYDPVPEKAALNSRTPVCDTQAQHSLPSPLNKVGH